MYCKILMIGRWLQGDAWRHDGKAVHLCGPAALNYPEMPDVLRLGRNCETVEVCVERVSLEPCHVRLYAPIWISNHSPFPLVYATQPMPPPLEAEAEENDETESSSIVEYTTPTSAPRVAGIAVEPKATSMLNTELGSIGVSLQVGSSAPCKAFLLDPQSAAAVVHAQQADGTVLSVCATLCTTATPQSMSLQVEPYITLLNRTGEVLKLRQSATDASPEQTLSTDGTPVPWIWQSGQRELAQAGGGEQVAFSVKGAGAEWSSLAHLDGGSAEREEMYLLLPGAKPELQLLHVVKRAGPVSGVQLLFQRPSRAQLPQLVENWTAAELSLRLAGPEAGAGAPWLTVGPMSAAPLAWGHRASASETLRVRLGRPAAWASDADQSLPSPVAAALDLGAGRERAIGTVALGDREGGACQAAVTLRRSREGTQHILALGREESALGMAASEAMASTEQKVTVRLPAARISLVDKKPEEVLLLSLGGIEVQLGSGLGASADSVLSVTVQCCQLDDQLAFTAFPVVLQHRANAEKPFLRFVGANSAAAGPNEKAVPYCGLSLLEEVDLRIHEPVIWRVFSLLQDLPSAEQPTVKNVDPMVMLHFFTTSQLGIKLWFLTDSRSRPRSLVGRAGAIALAFANLDRMPITIRSITMRDKMQPQSKLAASVNQNVMRQIMGQLMWMLQGVARGLLDNASRALGQTASFVTRIGGDGAESSGGPSNSESLPGALLDGGESLARGVFNGVTGVFTKPIEGAQKHGVGGFVMGIGKGVVGVATNTVGGALTLASKSVEGVSTTIKTVSSTIAGDMKASRERLPRSFSRDGVLRPYSEYSALGQHILRTAQVDRLLRGTTSSFADERYEAHYMLPEEALILFTNARIIYAKLASSGADLVREPCTIQWHVQWSNLRSVEVLQHMGNMVSKLVLQLHNKTSVTSMLSLEKVKCLTLKLPDDKAREIKQRLEALRSELLTDSESR
ncbi:hypothetical protein CYMTET_16610 [Cymbomonas tetramitiformis]|uniref:Intermembrane lipid transfer protein VPS13-like C-terminal domain-containing protein n=1 Tax=Cymbomonas tetramitiformis TaxID=36881 RepID=A0AAE0L7Z0_9CHLO|nr:hypothetical protein CYMTET_16610 [Cymbomonas tetramitiformis]